MQIATKDLLLAAAASPMPVERVEIPELNIVAHVRGMSGRERDAWEKSLIVGRGKHRDVNTENVRAKLVTRCLCDEQGKRLLDDGDAHTIGNMRVDVLNRIFKAAQKLSGVSDEDVDELGKPSETEGGSDSPTS